VAIGEAMAAARKRQGMTQLDLSQEVNYSREAIAKYEAGTRTLPREMYAKVTQKIDDPEFYFETWGITTGHVSIPYFDGEHVDQHPASMGYLVKQETEEALEHLRQICWAKPARVHNEEDRENVKRAMLEVLDAAASMVNLVAVLCKEHRLSMKDVFRAWQVSLKTRRLRK
jgi:transcriptional regulator with XRE-family HTH domain